MATLGEGRFAGERLYYRSWQPDVPSRGQVVISHGFAEHGGRYQHVAKALTAADLSVWAADHRGHGRSQGARADIESVWTAADDLGLFIDLVRTQAPEGQLFLVGHSMGGLIATAFAERHQDRLGCRSARCTCWSEPADRLSPPCRPPYHHRRRPDRDVEVPVGRGP